MMKKISFLTAAIVAFVLPTALPVYAQDVATPGDINIDDNTPEGKVKIEQEDAMNRFIALSLLSIVEQQFIGEKPNDQEICRRMLSVIDRELLAKCPEEFRKIINGILDKLSEGVKDPQKASAIGKSMDAEMKQLEECYTGLTGCSLQESVMGMFVWAQEHIVGTELEALFMGGKEPEEKEVKLIMQKLRDALKAQPAPFRPKGSADDLM